MKKFIVEDNNKEYFHARDILYIFDETEQEIYGLGKWILLFEGTGYTDGVCSYDEDGNPYIEPYYPDFDYVNEDCIIDCDDFMQEFVSRVLAGKNAYLGIKYLYDDENPKGYVEWEFDDNNSLQIFPAKRYYFDSIMYPLESELDIKDNITIKCLSNLYADRCFKFTEEEISAVE